MEIFKKYKYCWYILLVLLFQTANTIWSYVNPNIETPAFIFNICVDIYIIFILIRLFIYKRKYYERTN